VGFLAGGNEPTPHQLEGLGALPRKIWILEHFGTSEITSERSASFVFFDLPILNHVKDYMKLSYRLETGRQQRISL